MNVEKTARSAYQAALTEFRTAAGAIVERLKSGVPFSPADWEREKTFGNSTRALDLTRRLSEDV